MKHPVATICVIAALLAALTSCGAPRDGRSAAAGGDDPLTDTIAAIAAGYQAEIGVAVIVNDTDTFTVNNETVYPMMSVFKLHQALAVCRRADIALDSVMHIDRGELDPATWSPMLKEHREAEISLTVGELLRYALISSDNNASNLMFGRLAGVAETDSFVATLIPRGSFRISYTEAEMSRDHDKAYANRTSPSGAAALINRLFTDSLVSADRQRFVMQALRECATGTDRLPAPLAGKPGVTIAHKTGSGYTNADGVLAAHNDVGYVSLPDGTHYSIAVFVKDIKGDEASASEAISRISAAVYGALAGAGVSRREAGGL